MILALVVTGCSATAPNALSTSTTIETSTQSAEPNIYPASANNSIPPSGQAPPKLGCLDQPGTLHASAAIWYGESHGYPGGVFTIGPGSGSATSSAGLTALEEVVKSGLPGYLTADLAEGTDTSCAISRTVRMNKDDDSVFVSIWRLESKVDLGTVPNEDAPFVAVDPSTLVSQGRHLTVVLAVAANGTTVRSAAYGARSVGVISGWPTTITIDRTAAAPSVSVDELVTATQSILDEVTKRQQ
jgi:hypothetical protein